MCCRRHTLRRLLKPRRAEHVEITIDPEIDTAIDGKSAAQLRVIERLVVVAAHQ